MARTKAVDRPFLLITLLLVLIGFFLFSSASLGLIARDGARFSSVAINQLLFGVGGGIAAMVTLSKINYHVYRKYAPYLYIGALLLTCMVWVPGVGFSAGGATRWLHLFGFSFQPAEALKIGFVVGLAWLYARWPRDTNTLRFGVLPYAALCTLTGAVLLLQPDMGSFLIVAAAGGAMYIAAGARVTHLALLLVLGLCAVGVLVTAKPYLMDRISTFINPAQDLSGSGYHVHQSLLAIGSGGLLGRGYGQSVQKFNYLPEPISDSIFSVAAEEFGFVGASVLIALFIVFALRGLHIASHARDRFGGLVVVGLVILMISQSFANIGSMLGVIPLTGEPLVFISHGGSALLFALASVGIILSISRYSVAAEGRRPPVAEQGNPLKSRPTRAV